MKKMKAVVTGAAGFLGANLVEELVKSGYQVLAVVRKDSAHNSRIEGLNGVRTFIAESDEYDKLPAIINEKADIFYHLMWSGGKTIREQEKYVHAALSAVESAKSLGCSRFVAAGSQAEYGPCHELITEETLPHPVTAYGACKFSANILTRVRAKELGIDWIWDRVFSVYGKYEPRGRMLPDLISALEEGRIFRLSACTQNWDYLYSSDAARAVIATGECGRNGEIYNVANGDYHPLKYFTDLVHRELLPDGILIYDENNHPEVSLQPSVDKLMNDTGWKPTVVFSEGVKEYLRWERCSVMQS